MVATSDALWSAALGRICHTVYPGSEIRGHRTAAAALESLAVEEADLAFMSLGFPDADGLAVLELFRKRSRLLLIVSTRKDDWTMMTLRTARFDAFFDPCDDDPSMLEQVLPRIVAGAAYFSRSVKDRLEALRFPSVLTEKLTATELKVFRIIGAGSTDAEAARMLGVSERTVETHRQNIRNKLGVCTTAKLVMEALRLGIVRDIGRHRLE